MGFLRKAQSAAESSFTMRALVSRLRKKRKSELDESMVIGIDFGTTYSGAAWATIADFESEQINLITTWPGTGREEGKAPTELFYEDGRLMWGYNIPADAEPLRWFKLLLLREEDLAPQMRESEFILRGRKMLRENHKSATDLVADYLRELWKHILDTIHKARGESVIDALQFHVVITVPAIWKGYARQGMEDAARKAGILDPRDAGATTLGFAPEPEAAALATICEPGRSIDTGDSYIICDAGGGTVDLISYTVGDLDPIELHEAGIGTGGLCGGIFIDEAFESICKTRLGRSWNKLSQTGIKEIMKDNWEYAIKPQFKLNDSTKSEYIVSVPAEAFNGSNLNDDNRKPVIKNGRIHFSSSDIQTAFAGVFSDIEKLIDGQISKSKEKKLSVTGIILVGGLGSSPYLYEFLKSKYERKKIKILQSTGIRPRTAICRGAIFKGFLDGPTSVTRENGESKVKTPVSVVSTVARQSLGVTYQERFQEGVHSEEDKRWDETEGVSFASSQMCWFLKKVCSRSTNHLFTPEEVLSNNFYRTFRNPGELDGSMDEEIMQCDDDEPPSRLTSSVRPLCDVKCRLAIPYSALHDYKAPNGNRLKKVDFDIEMVPSGASVEFAVLFEGEKLGSEHAKIQFQ